MAKNTPPKFGPPTLLEELLADPSLTIASALKEFEQELEQATGDTTIPELQFRAAILLHPEANNKINYEGDTALSFTRAASDANLPAARFRIDKPNAKAIKKNLASTGDYGRSTLV
jgi:hypothetical protein